MQAQPHCRQLTPTRLLAMLSLLCLTSCALDPLQHSADRYGMQTSAAQTDYFLHKVLSKPGAGDSLHIYIEGDGRPWRSRYQIASDPSPHRLLMPELMQQDSAPSVFIGRPCYFNTEDSACSPVWWTHQRYSEEVVASMNAVIDRVLLEQRALEERKIVLIGHSGGGTLAWLLAARRKDVESLITLAGNLDIDAWTEHHGFSTLEGSINPAKQEPLDGQISQWHYLGRKDTVIRRSMLETFLQRQTSAQLVMLDDVDHRCCWQDEWPKVLQRNLHSFTQPPP